MKKLFLIVFFYLIQVSFVNAQTLKLGNQNFVKEKNKWFVVDKYNKYEVNERSITVKLKENVSESALNTLNKNKGVIIERSNDLGYIDLLLPEGSKFDEMFTHLVSSGIFESVEVNSYGATCSNDPGFSSQYYLYNHLQYSPDRPQIHASLVESGTIEDGSTNPVTVAVIGFGVDNTNQELNMSSYGWNFIENNNDPYPYDGSSHETGVAGIIGAKTNNGQGVAGVAGGNGANSGAKIMSLRVSYLYEYLGKIYQFVDNSLIDDAILYAANNGAKAINMSFKTAETSAITNAINYAFLQKGCVLVAATGNKIQSTIPYPASHPKVIAVGGIDHLWNNYGGYGPGLDLVAPAKYIYSTLNVSPTTGSYAWGYLGQGTSFSAPQVAGVAALLLSHNQNLLHLDIENILKKKAYRDYDEYDSQHDGSGILDAMGALDDLYSPSPSIPQNVVLSGNIGGYPTISWSAVEGATNYKIYRAHSPNGRYSYSLAATTTNTSWTDNSYPIVHPRFAPYTNYYRVTAFDGYYESITSAEVTSYTNATNKKNPGSEQIEPLEYSLESNY
ncbi:MAG: S8 family serine peptidase, partial [Ignavibacteria bacterium]|nr:S8 family serine peptidase [Ignavibacteria bacterium]